MKYLLSQLVIKPDGHRSSLPCIFFDLTAVLSGPGQVVQMFVLLLDYKP